MGKQKRHSPEQAIAKLREAEVLLARGMTTEQVCRQLEVSAHTYYRWRKKYGGLKVDQAKQLKELEEESARLRKLVVDQALDIDFLREAAKGNF